MPETAATTMKAKLAAGELVLCMNLRLARSVDIATGNSGAAAPTTPAKIRQAIMATPKAGVWAVRVSNRRSAATAATTAAGIVEA